MCVCVLDMPIILQRWQVLLASTLVPPELTGWELAGGLIQYHTAPSLQYYYQHSSLRAHCTHVLVHCERVMYYHTCA